MMSYVQYFSFQTIQRRSERLRYEDQYGRRIA